MTGRRKTDETRVYMSDHTAVIFERGWMFVYSMATGELIYALALKAAGA